MPSDRLMYSPEVEQAVLAAALLDPVSADRVIQDLSEADFAEPRHQAIYRAVCALAKNGRSLNTLSLHERLQETAEADMVGGIAYLSGLDVSLPNLHAVPDMISTLHDRALRRAIVDSAREAARKAREAEDPADAILQQHRRALEEAEQRLSMTGELREACEVAEEVVTSLSDASVTAPGIMSGIGRLDLLTHGLQPGRLYIVGGRPGTGKSALAQHYMQAAAKANQSVAFISLEMGSDEILRRMLSNLSGVDHGHIHPGSLLAGELQRIEKAQCEMEGWKAWISDEAIETPQRILAAARRHQREQGLDLLIIDYLQLMASDQKYENRNLEVAAATRAMKLGARELGCPIILLSQLNRLSERRAGGRPLLSDLRDSGASEQDADVVMLMWAPGDANVEEANESWRQTHSKILEIDVAKNRHGPMGSATVSFMGWLLRFQEVTS